MEEHDVPTRIKKLTILMMLGLALREPIIVHVTRFVHLISMKEEVTVSTFNAT